jgi:hypothetical protein
LKNPGTGVRPQAIVIDRCSVLFGEISAAKACDESIDVVQRASQTAAALNKLGARHAAGSDRLAQLVRKDAAGLRRAALRSGRMTTSAAARSRRVDRGHDVKRNSWRHRCP